MTAVSVTAAHIAAGTPGDCALCPVALAVLDAIPGLAYLRVYCETIVMRPRPDGDLADIEMPDAVQDFIWAFDRDGTAAPFTFELDYPVSGTGVARPWPGQPETCTCRSPVTATFEQTLTCPLRWWPLLPSGGWAHTPWWAR